MKKFNLILALLLLTVSISLAQTPEQFKYQAVLRDASGNIIVNQNKAVIINILQGSATGTSVFTETHNVTTTAQGLIHINIGSVNPLSSIDWSSSAYFIKITVDGVEMGTSQLLSVPYALHAKTVKNETDPIFITSPAFGVTSTNLANWNTAFGWGNHSTVGYLTSFTETDPIFGNSPAHGITSTNLANWNTAFGWGNHAGLYRPISYIPAWSEITSNPFVFNSPANNQLVKYNSSTNKWENWTPNYLSSYTENDPVFSNHPAIGITTNYINNWNTAYSWGNHATAGYLTSFTESDPIFGASPANGITANLITNWNTAFSWGNHASLYRPIGYVPTWSEILDKPNFATIATTGSFSNLLNIPTTLSGYGITDAMSITHAANSITSTNLANWNTAYGWGNHAGLYRPITYVPTWSEILSKPNFATVATSGSFGDLLNIPTTLNGYGITDAMSITHTANSITSTNLANWNTAYGWGNHAGLYRPIDYVPTWTEVLNKPIFANVATSGNYNDLSNLPTAGTGIFINGSNQIYNTAPDQTVSLIGNGSISVTGTYPNFTINSPLHNSIMDADNNTKITVEQNPNENKIRFTLNGSEKFRIEKNAIYVINTNGNVLFGDSTGFLSTGGHNTFLGALAGRYNTTGAWNTFVGSYTGTWNSTGYNNIFIGNACGAQNQTGASNTFVGTQSGYWSNGDLNTFIGHRAGNESRTGSNNTYIGNESGKLSTAGSNNVFIGYQSGLNEMGSNKLYISNSSTTTPLIYGEFDNKVVTINDVLKLTPRSTAPSNPTNGTMYVGTDNHMYCYLNGLWKQIDGGTSTTSGHYVGELYGGGIVFWVSPDGLHGLIASLADLDGGSGVAWSNVSSTAIGSTALSMTNGSANTTAIISQAGHTSSAAKLCRNYTAGGFTDWYLPSNRVLVLLASQDVLIDYILDNDGNSSTVGFAQEYVAPTYGSYWSSTEHTSTQAWNWNFRDDYFAVSNKTTSFRVRAVRAF